MARRGSLRRRRRRKKALLWGHHPRPRTQAAVRKGLSHSDCVTLVYTHSCRMRSFHISILQTYQMSLLNISPPPHSCKKSGETPSTPTTPTSPTTPTTPTHAPRATSFPPAPVTTDNVRNKCRELLVAALQTDGEKTHWPCAFQQQRSALLACLIISCMHQNWLCHVVQIDTCCCDYLSPKFWQKHPVI